MHQSQERLLGKELSKPRAHSSETYHLTDSLTVPASYDIGWDSKDESGSAYTTEQDQTILTHSLALGEEVIP